MTEVAASKGKVKKLCLMRTKYNNFKFKWSIFSEKINYYNSPNSVF